MDETIPTPEEVQAAEAVGLNLPGDLSPEEFSGVMAGLFAIGAILKHALPNLNNRWIPLILLPIGVAATLAFAKEVSFKSVVVAVLGVAAAIGVHQLLKTSSGKDI